MIPVHADEHDASNVRGRSGRRPRRVRALVVAGIVALVVVSSIALRAIAFPAPALASSSTLAVLGGEVALAIGAAEFVEATDGELVQPGDRVRTGTDGYALLTYFDGSTVELEPRTEIAVDALRATTAGDIMVAMTLGAGRTWHVIARRLTDRSQYEVTTDSLSASVRGTAFEVRRDPDGRSVVATSEGVVATTAAGQTVEVAEGQSTEVPAPGAPPSAPAPIAEPDITVTVSVGATQNALVTDGKGRTVGVRNGQPILYVPGSRVAIVDGRLVITIPGVESGRLTTLVRPSPGEDGITLRTEVRRRGVGVVGSTEETRSVDADGNARGGVVVTATGVDILPESDARSANPPKIGRRPRPPAPDFPIPFSAPPPPEPSEIVPPASPTGAFPTASSRRATGTPGSVPSRAPTATPALGQTSSPTSSSTSGPTSTATRGATATPSSASSPSATSTPEPTSTPTATATPTATPTPTATATPTPTVTATANRTATAVPTATATASPSATATPH